MIRRIHVKEYWVEGNDLHVIDMDGKRFVFKDVKVSDSKTAYFPDDGIEVEELEFNVSGYLGEES